MRRGFHINITVYILCLVAVLGLWQSPIKAAELPPLGQFLNERGELDFPEGFAGSVDPTGFIMRQEADGRPRFMPTGGDSGNPVTGYWETFGGVNFGCYGYVDAIAVAPSGIVYIGGHFTLCEDVEAFNIVAYNLDSNSFLPLGSGKQNGVDYPGTYPASVKALAIVGTDLYVGGAFTEAGGQSAKHIARWDGSQWHALESGGHNGVGFYVNALAVSGTDLYVGGTFTEAGGQTVNGIARWDGGQWHALESGGQIGVHGGLYGYGVRALVVSGTNLYVGGEFTEAGDQSANNIALWDGEQWQALESGGGNGVNYQVSALAVLDTDLYVGGVITEAGGQSVNNIARWDGSEWHALESGVGDFGSVNALAVFGTDLFVGGRFYEAGGQNANHIARWDGSQWHALESGVQDGLSIYSVNTLAVSGTDLFVGGNFTEAGGRNVNGIALWSGKQWHTVGQGEQSGMNGVVSVMEASGEDLYAGGSFTQAGGDTNKNVNRVARWNGGQWYALESSGQNGVPYSFFVQALAISGTDLFVGGRFTRAGDQDANHVARWDGSQWHALGSGKQNGVNIQGDASGGVRALAVVGTDLYVGGKFYWAGGQPALNIARWDGNQWHSLESNGYNGVDGGVGFPDGVFAMAVSGKDLYVGGDFYSAGGQNMNNIARWNGEQWYALESGGQIGVSGRVAELAVSDTDLYAGGRFGTAGGQSVNHIARWDGNQWHALESGVSGLLSGVNALAFSGMDLYVGGVFTEAGGQSANNIALWDGSQWHALESGGWTGLSGGVSSLTAQGDVLHVGGSFTTAGGELSIGFARFVRVLFQDRFETGDPPPDGPSGVSMSVAGEND